MILSDLMTAARVLYLLSAIGYLLFIRFRTKNWLPAAIAALGLFFHTAFFVAQGLKYGVASLPDSSRLGPFLYLTWGIVAVSLWFEWRKKAFPAGALSMCFAWILLSASHEVPHPAGANFGLLGKSVWFLLESGSIGLAFSFFITASIFAFVYLVKKEVKTDTFLASFSALASIALGFIGGARFFGHLKFDFYEVARNTNGQLVILNFETPSGKRVAEFVSVAGGGWILALVILAFLGHAVGTVVSNLSAKHREKLIVTEGFGGLKERLSTSQLWLRRGFFSAVLGLWVLLSQIYWSDAHVPGFKIGAEPLRVAGVFVLAVLGIFFAVFVRLRPLFEETLGDTLKWDDLSYRSATTGLVWMTFALFFGAIWANQKWGHYWNFSPIELGSALTWLYFLFYHSSRTTGEIQARSASLLVLGGSFLVFLDILGLSLYTFG